MILYAPLPTGSALFVTPDQIAAEHAVIQRAPQVAGSSADPDSPNSFSGGTHVESVAYGPIEKDVNDEFDWNDPRTNKQFVQLEQKALAKKASREELIRYEIMRSSRNSEIFADRAIRDYAEVQRLKKLTEKLAEVQKFLRPINF